MKTIERTATGAAELGRQALKLRNYGNAGSAWQLICSAEDNAGTTCMEERIERKSDEYGEKFNEFFWGSLEGLLCGGEASKPVQKWFANRGVRW